MKTIANKTAHKHQVLDDLMLEPGQSVPLTDEQAERLSGDKYFEALREKGWFSISEKAEKAPEPAPAPEAEPEPETPAPRDETREPKAETKRAEPETKRRKKAR